MNLREQFIDILRIKYGLTLDTDVYTRIDNWKAWFDG